MTWQTKKLGDLAVIIDGTHQTPKYVNNGVPFYSVENVTANNFSDTKFISEKVYDQELEYRKIRKNDILMTRIGDIGTAKLINWNVRASFYVSLALIRCDNSQIIPNYLVQVINSNIFKKEALKRSLLVAFPNKINLGDINKCTLKIPGLAEQERIVGVLEVWDAYLEKLERKIELKEKLKKGLAQQIFSRKLIINDDFSEWNSVKLSNVVSVKKGQQLNREKMYGGQYPVINGGTEPSGYVDECNAEENTITVSEGGNSCGFVNYIKKPFWCGGHCYMIDTKDNSKEYIYQLLKNEEMKIKRLRVGSGLPNIQRGDLLNYKVIVSYSLVNQKQIADILTSCDNEIAILKSKKSQIEQQKKSLLKKLVSGEIRTPEDILEKGVIK